MGMTVNGPRDIGMAELYGSGIPDAQAIIDLQNNGEETFYLYRPHRYLFRRHMTLLLATAAIVFFTYRILAVVMVPWYLTVALKYSRFVKDCAVLNFSEKKLWALYGAELILLFLIFAFVRQPVLAAVRAGLEWIAFRLL